MSRAELLKANILAPGVALGVGLPAAFAAPGVAESVQQRDIRPAIRSIADSAGYAVGGGLPLLAATGLGVGASYGVGRLLGTPETPTHVAQNTAAGTLPGRATAVQRAQRFYPGAHQVGQQVGRVTGQVR